MQVNTHWTDEAERLRGYYVMKVSDIEFDDEAFKAVVLDVSSSLGIEDADDVIELRCRKKKISSVKGIEHFKNLKLLDLTRNNLTDLDLTHNRALQELYLGNNQLDSLDLSPLSELFHLEIFINDISELKLDACPKLENLYANANDLTSLDLSANPNISEIQVSDNNISDINLPEGVLLGTLKAENNPLPESVKERLKSRVKTHKLKI